MWFKAARTIVSGKNQILQILNNPELLNVVRAISSNDTAQLAGAYFLNKNVNPETLKNELMPQLEELINKKRVQLKVSKKSISINNKELNEFLDFSEEVHGLFSILNPQTNLEIQTSNDDLKVEDNKIKIIPINNVTEAVRFGMDQSWCIAQPGNTMWQSYRDTQGSTFYFVFDGTRPEGDPLRKVAVDMNENGVQLTDVKNTTGTIAVFGSDWKKYFEYLKSKGVNTAQFAEKPQTQAEKEESKVLMYINDDLRWFKKLPYDMKSKYIGRGHRLSDEQFYFLIENNARELLNQYVDLGMPIPENQFSKLPNQLKTTYIRKMGIAIDVMQERNQLYALISKINDAGSQTAAFIVLNKIENVNARKDSVWKMKNALMSGPIDLKTAQEIYALADYAVIRLAGAMTPEALNYLLSDSTPKEIWDELDTSTPIQPESAMYIIENILPFINNKSRDYDYKIDKLLSVVPNDKILTYFQKLKNNQAMALPLFGKMPHQDQIEALKDSNFRLEDSERGFDNQNYTIEPDIIEQVFWATSSGRATLWGKTDKEAQQKLINLGEKPRYHAVNIHPDLISQALPLLQSHEITQLLNTYPDKYKEFIGYLHPTTIAETIPYNQNHFIELLHLGADPNTILYKVPEYEKNNNYELLIELIKYGVLPKRVLKYLNPKHIDDFIKTGLLKEKLTADDITWIDSYIVLRLAQAGLIEMTYDIFNEVDHKYWYQLKKIYDQQNAQKPYISRLHNIHHRAQFKGVMLGMVDFKDTYNISYRLYPNLIKRNIITPDEALDKLKTNIWDETYYVNNVMTNNENDDYDYEQYYNQNYEELEKNSNANRKQRFFTNGANGYHNEDTRNKINNLIKWLVELGGNPNLIISAIDGKDLEMIKWLIGKGADGRLLLSRVEQIISVPWGDQATYNELLKLGATVPQPLQTKFIYRYNEYEPITNAETIAFLLNNGILLKEIILSFRGPDDFFVTLPNVPPTDQNKKDMMEYVKMNLWNIKRNPQYTELIKQYLGVDIADPIKEDDDPFWDDDPFADE